MDRVAENVIMWHFPWSLLDVKFTVTASYTVPFVFGVLKNLVVSEPRTLLESYTLVDVLDIIPATCAV